MSLRTKLIEAGARAFHDPGVEPHDDDRHSATLVLDAFLDCLAENADEWKRAAYEVVPDTNRDVFGSAALAVLRDSDV